MATKITIDLNGTLAERAKKYAEEQGRSLSSLVESFLIEVLKEKEKKKYLEKETLKPLPKSFQRLEGILQNDKDFDYKEELTKALTEKYGV